MNAVSGLRAADDPSIMAWETGNELSAPTNWTADIAGVEGRWALRRSVTNASEHSESPPLAAFIKSIDPNHLVLDGNYGINSASLPTPQVGFIRVWVDKDVAGRY